MPECSLLNIIKDLSAQIKADPENYSLYDEKRQLDSCLTMKFDFDERRWIYDV